MPNRPPVIAEDEAQAAALSMRRIVGMSDDDLGSQADSPAMLADPEMRKRYLEEVAKERARRERIKKKATGR